jgi:hypothetical protein
MTTEPLTTAALPSPSIPVVDPPSANAPSAPVLDADLAIRTITLLQSLLEKVMGERNAEESGKRATVRHTYTPRSIAPLIQLATPPVLPTRLRRRSLVFGCPCCGRETVVIRSQAGARIRCPHCQSAVAAPHPRRRRSAHNLEKDIEAVLHPQAFAEAVRPMAPRLVRMVAKEPVLILALAALVPFTWLLMLEIPSFIERAKGGIPNTVARTTPAVRANSLADGASERAVALVERYLAAPTVQAKADWVRDPQRVAPLMAALAKRQPDLFAPVTGAEVKAAGLSHYQDPSNPVPVTPVVAALADGTRRTFFVEHTEQGDVIEWESSLGYSEPLEMAAARRGKVSPPARAVWRVEAAPDDYFNRAFTDEEHLVCLRLSRADRPDETFWAYAPKDSEVGQSLRRIWNEAPRDFVQRLTVTVEGGAATAKTRQVRLTEVHHAGWRTPDQPATMVAKNH